MRFKNYLDDKNLTEDMQDKIMLIMYLAENSNTMNESYDLHNLTEAQELELIEGINDWLGKVGLKLHKGKGIIDYLIGFTKGAGELIIAAVKKDKDKVKEIAGRLDKATVIDFLLKLDMATMHIVTGPIHFVDAVTGWDLLANIKHASETAVNKIQIFYQAMKRVKDSIQTLLSGAKQKKMLKVAGALEYNMPDA